MSTETHWHAFRYQLISYDVTTCQELANKTWSPLFFRNFKGKLRHLFHDNIELLSFVSLSINKYRYACLRMCFTVKCSLNKCWPVHFSKNKLMKAQKNHQTNKQKKMYNKHCPKSTRKRWKDCWILISQEALKHPRLWEVLNYLAFTEE